MTDNELKKLSRKDLLEMLIQQGKENEQLKAELEEVKAELENREITARSAGTMAEAALQLNEVFQAADRAVEQYVENMKMRADRQNRRRLEKRKREIDREAAEYLKEKMQESDEELRKYLEEKESMAAAEADGTDESVTEQES